MSEFKYIDVDNEEQEITTDTHTKPQYSSYHQTTCKLREMGESSKDHAILDRMGKGKANLLYFNNIHHSYIVI